VLVHEKGRQLFHDGISRSYEDREECLAKIPHALRVLRVFVMYRLDYNPPCRNKKCAHDAGELDGFFVTSRENERRKDEPSHCDSPPVTNATRAGSMLLSQERYRCQTPEASSRSRPGNWPSLR
jgi:hypothetical protein